MVDRNTILPGSLDEKHKANLLTQLDGLIKDLRLEYIKSVAWKRKFEEALSLLKDFPKGENPDPRLLDLQARIFAQQGRLSDAESTWKAALKVDPNNPVFLAGLTRIAEIRSRPYWLKPVLNLISWGLLFLLLIFGSLFWISRTQTVIAENDPGYSTSSNQDQILLDSLAQLKFILLDITSGSAETEFPDFNLDIEGIIVQQENGELFILFEEGLFKEGTAFQPHALELLTKLAQELERYGKNISLTIFGLADRIPLSPSSLYHDNNELGMARALKVHDHLRQHSNLPWNKVLIGSLGGAAYPFINEANTNQFNNRSVVIQVYQ